MQYIQFLLEHWILSGLFILVLLMLVAVELRTKMTGANKLTPMAAVQMINKQNAKVIDIREKGAFNDGHIVNSIYLAKDDIDQNSEKLKKYQDVPIIIVCAQGIQSSNIGAKLQKQSFKQVFLLQGGINAWKAEGLPLTKE